jgi:hypothetical protein
MSRFNHKNINGNADMEPEFLKTLVVGVIVGLVVLTAGLISMYFLREGKNPFEGIIAVEEIKPENESNTDTVAEEEDINTTEEQEFAGETAALEASDWDAPYAYYEEPIENSFSFEDACFVCIDRTLTGSDIDAIKEYAPANLPETPVQMAINYVYAWYGYHFNTDTIRQYFLKTDWYTDRGRDSDECDSLMNSVQKENLEILKRLR